MPARGRLAGRGGELGDDDRAGLVGEHEQNRPLGELHGLAEAVAPPVEAQSQPEPGLAQVRDHRQGLDDKAEQHADAEEPLALRWDVRDPHAGVR